MRRLAAQLLVLWLVTATGVAFGFDGGRLPGFLRDFSPSERPLARGGLRLLRRGDLDDTVRAHVAARVALAQLEMRADEVVAKGGAGTYSRSYRFRHRGVPLCSGMVRAHELASGKVLILGNAPDLADDAAPASRDMPDGPRARERAQSWAETEIGARKIKTRLRGTCFAVTERALRGAWRIDVEADGLPYRLFVDEQRVFAAEERFFAVDGQARVFPHNRLDTETELRPLTGLLGDGTLRSEDLEASVPDAWPEAEAPDHVFDFPPEDLRFDQVQAFYHGTEHLAFTTMLGFDLATIDGVKPVQVRLHTPPNGSKNNALYLEGDEDSHAKILIDDGDGIGLRNLASDADVVSHELGHHVIFKTLKRKTGEGLVLHEGLADFLVFARTGNGCLGESICPPSSTSCQVKAQCLRSTTIDVSYDDDTWKEWLKKRGGALGHLHSQLISGMLWGLRERGEVVADELTATVARSIALLAEQSGIHEFLLALFAADEELYGRKNFARIYAAMSARNLGSFLEGVTPPSAVEMGPNLDAPPAAAVPATDPPASPVIAAENPVQATPEVKPEAPATPELRPPGVPAEHEEETYKRKCGVVSSEAVGQPGSLFALAMLLAAPVLVLVVGRKRS